MPATERSGTSIHVNLQKSRLEFEEGLSIANQVLSLVAWKEDAPASLGNEWSQNPTPIPMMRRAAVYPPPSRWRVWPHKVAPLRDVAGRQAIAFYREARTLEQYNFLPYAALSYYKMLEIKFKGPSRGVWLETTITSILDNIDRTQSQNNLVIMMGSDAKSVADFLYKKVRQAAAHADKDFVNPDDMYDVKRLDLSLNLLRILTRIYIRDELHVLI